MQSLLVSQKSTILENVSEGVSRAAEAELTSSLRADALVGKGEFASRYQTSRSSNVQTSRRAIIQSLFKELREVGLDYRLAPSNSVPAKVTDLESIDDPERSIDAATIQRGSLIEVNVILRVDPVYRLAAIMAEYGAMADIWPAMFGQHGLLGTLRATQPVIAVLERFLAGLIPIKARAVDLVVVEQGDHRYVVDKRVLPSDLATSAIPLDIVGVTEQSGYWKDLRRILYSEGEFVMLCRVARPGLQESWTPVKLADLFSEVAPGLVESINAIRPPSSGEDGTPQKQPDAFFQVAIQHYYDGLIAEIGAEQEPDVSDTLQALIGTTNDVKSATQQREAFDAVREFVAGRHAAISLTAERDLELRSAARAAVNLPILPSRSPATAEPAVETAGERRIERLLDVEVIAIYW